MTKKLILLTTIILSSPLYSDTTTLKNGKVYHNAKVFHKGGTVTVSFECGKQIVINKSEISETEMKPLTRWKTQEECNQSEEEAKQAAEKRKEEEARRKEEKRLQEEQRRQELALKKQECEAKGDVWNGKDCSKKSVTPIIPKKKEITGGGKWSEYQGEMNWYMAKATCESIGMRLPTIEELKLAYTSKLTESWKKNGYNYWSSTPTGGDRAYGFTIIDGNSYDFDSNIPDSVRCIQSKGAKTNIWSDKWSAHQGKMNWGEAKKKCASIGMRLPTIKELKTAYEDKIIEPWDKDVPLHIYWSATPYGHNGDAWLIISTGNMIHSFDASNFYVRCIRANVAKDSGIWSNYQGKMKWDDAKKKCASIGMRLPTLDEFEIAAYDEYRIVKSWGEDGYHWSDNGAYDLTGIREDKRKLLYPLQFINNLNVRCFR